MSRARICKRLKEPIAIDSASLCSLVGSYENPICQRPVRLHRVAELIPLNRFLGSFYKFGLCIICIIYTVQSNGTTVTRRVVYILLRLYNFLASHAYAGHLKEPFILHKHSFSILGMNHIFGSCVFRILRTSIIN